jgi:TRAP transporter 4TM/12TM fusion protein
MVVLVAVAWSAFQIYTAGFGLLHVLLQRAVHVSFALTLGFLLYPFSRDRTRRSTFLDYLPAGLSAALLVYVVVSAPRITTRMELVDEVLLLDIAFGVLMIVCVLEVCRRTAGTCLSLVGIVFIGYAFLGPVMPGILRHSGTTLSQFIDVQFLSVQGLFSEPVGVSAEIVFYFVLFGAFLDRSGAGKLFGDIAYTLTGRTRGGPAKSAVVASSLFGMISGSAVGNVAVVGTFTIPLMKKAGYSPHLAAAIEATASTGGQIMPPVMGAAAFLMADLTRIPYSQIIVHAAIPAILYYLSIFFVVDFEAWKQGLRGTDALSFTELRRGLLERIHLLVPLGMLIYLMTSGFSLMRSALLAILSVVVISVIRRATAMGPAKMMEALDKGAREALTVAIPSAVAGIVVGVIVFSGLGLKLTGILIELSHGSLLLALLFTMIACIILGMGMPTSAAYLIAAVLMAPALIKLGVPVLVAHMFVFCFAVISMITPPVALATYAAASIAGSAIWKTGLSAFTIAFASFLIPYAFVFNHGLLFIGTWPEVLWVTGSTALGVCFLAAVYVGFLAAPLSRLDRVLLFGGALLLIHPGVVTDLIGLAVGAVVLWLARRRVAFASA